MKIIEGYRHEVASHCETGSLRNLMAFSGKRVSEALVFGIGSGPTFYYLFFAKGPSKFPLIGIRNQPGKILANFSKRCHVDIDARQYPSTKAAFTKLDELIDAGTPAIVSVDMFYMKYLPSFLRVHAPFHFIVIFGKENGQYRVSDPYNESAGLLDRQDLEAAWNTHAKLARDNFLAYITHAPEDLGLEQAMITGIRDCCKNMILPPVFNKVFAFMGIEGIKMYARKILEWPTKYRGVTLREGILFNAVGIEDQGTGGGAFRLMYGAFLHEVGETFNSDPIVELASQMLENGEQWRQISRKFIVLGKKVPMDESAYDDWYRENGDDLHEGLREISKMVYARADFELDYFKRLQQISNGLKGAG